MSERIRAALGILLALTDDELARIEQSLPLVRRVARMCEDQASAAGLTDLTSEQDVLATLAEMDRDLERLLESSQQRVEVPSQEQVVAVIAAATPAVRGPIVVAATAGLRRGEVFALRWSDLDCDQRLIRVRSSNSDGTITRTKTNAGERLVPMFGSLRRLLLEQRAASRYSADTDLVFPDHRLRRDARGPAAAQ
jgi:integrase